MITKKRHTILGESVTSLERFYDVISEIMNDLRGYFGRNLDSFLYYLKGGFNTPEEFIIRWEQSDISREALSYPETIKHLERILIHCHPTNKKEDLEDLECAKRKESSTVFDWLVDIISEANNIDLILERLINRKAIP